MALNEKALRFIRCYNQIDTALRSQGDMNHNISYTEAVRRASRTNAFVKKYEDVLVDYGRLRNAIVHSFNEDSIIAEPHDDVVEEYEKIANIICTPPRAIDTSIVNKEYSILPSDRTIAQVMEFMFKNGFSNVPIYKDNMLIGVANAKKILKELGKKLYEKKDINEFVINTNIEEITKAFSEDNYYALANQNITLDKVIDMFTENRKLMLIIITKTGSLLEHPIGLIATGDILEMNKVLDNYN